MFQIVLAFLVGVIGATAVAWARLRIGARRQRQAEEGFARAQRETAALRLDLERADNRLVAALDAYPRPVFVISRDRVIIYANDPALGLIHLPASQVIGRRAASVLQDYDTTQLLVRATRENLRYERTFQRVTTGQTWRVVATPLRIGGEKSGGEKSGQGALAAGGSDIVLSIEDLTEMRRLESVRRDFVAHVSHELRTPLAAMKLLAETLVTALERDPAAARGFALRITTEADHLSQMVAELLDLSRIESGNIKLRLEPTDLAALAQVAVDRMAPLAVERGVTLEAEPSGDLPDALCDGERIGEALINLIHNALKYTDTGGWVRVSIALIEEEAPNSADGAAPGMRRMLATSVSDNGAGISADDLPRIFERFFKVDRARTRAAAAGVSNTGAATDENGAGATTGAFTTTSALAPMITGTGLGLAITRHLIELQGGRIWVESKLGHGSRFTFTLPVVEGAAGLQ
jgi:two-component system phosphate regulon sensor histidine kinase PhoR